MTAQAAHGADTAARLIASRAMSDRIPRPLAAVFFDAGDTLLAPYPSFVGRFVLLAAEAGVPVSEAAAEAAVAASLRRAAWPANWTDPATQRAFWEGFYAGVLDDLAVDGDREWLAGRMYAAFSDPATYRLFDDVRPALRALAARGLKLGVISNFEPWLEQVLEQEGVRDRFAATAISGVLGVAKPEPGIFKAALDQAGVPAEACLHVGDSLDADVAGARAVGMTPVLIDRHGRQPATGELRVETLAELVGLIEGG
jgi:putative hydrolase of the HAD superfamily